MKKIEIVKTLKFMYKQEWNQIKHWCCGKVTKCSDCPFSNIRCENAEDEDSWINNKNLYSDKFLNKKIKITIEEIEK